MKQDDELRVKNKRNEIIKKRLNIMAVFLAVVLFVLGAGVAGAETKYPRPKGTAVNDFAGVIDADASAKMESLAHEILQKTGTSVVVATVPTMGENEDIRSYAADLYQAWGIGKKGEDKGVLIFLAVQERKIRIETGYGVEGILPDGLIGEILDKDVVPHLKAGETGKGLYNAMFACGSYLAADAGAALTGIAAPYRSKAAPQGKGMNVAGVILFLIAAAFLLGTRTGREMLPWILLMLMSGSGRGGGRDDGFGGGFGGFGGGMSGGGGADRGF